MYLYVYLLFVLSNILNLPLQCCSCAGIHYSNSIYNADRNLHLGDINKASGESWQVLNEEEKDIYIKRAAEEASSCSGVDLRQILKQLSKLVCQIYCTWCLNIMELLTVDYNW